MEAVRGDQKENIGTAPGKGFSTVAGKRGSQAEALLPYSTPKSFKASAKLAAKSVKKTPRRALGDISNQANHERSGGKRGDAKDAFGEAGLAKKTALKSRTTERKANILTRTQPVGNSPPVENKDDLEFAYGGLPSTHGDAAYRESTHMQLMLELSGEHVPTPMELYRVPQDSLEIRLLAAEAEDSWWSELPTSVEDDAPEVEEPSAVDVPLACELAEHERSILDDILNVDIPVCVDGEPASP